MSLKDLREKFHDLDSKISSVFHKEKEGVKKPSWEKIIPTWLALIIVLSLASSVAISFVTVDVNEELTPVFAEYNLEHSSNKSSLYFISSPAGSKEVFHIAYEGKLNVKLNSSNIHQNDQFGKVMESYSNGNNEYNASVDIELTAYDSNNKKINTSYTMGLDDGYLNIKHELIDLLLFNGSKIDFQDGILSLTFIGSDQRLSDSSFDSSLSNIDHIDGVIHIFNKNSLDKSDSGYYSYTINFKIPKSSIIINP
jgi:hypothetical protein